MSIFQTIKVLYTLTSFQIDLIENEGMFSVNTTFLKILGWKSIFRIILLEIIKNFPFYIRKYDANDVL